MLSVLIIARALVFAVAIRLRLYRLIVRFVRLCVSFAPVEIFEISAREKFVKFPRCFVCLAAIAIVAKLKRFARLIAPRVCNYVSITIQITYNALKSNAKAPCCYRSDVG